MLFLLVCLLIRSTCSWISNSTIHSCNQPGGYGEGGENLHSRKQVTIGSQTQRSRKTNKTNEQKTRQLTIQHCAGAILTVDDQSLNKNYRAINQKNCSTTVHSKRYLYITTTRHPSTVKPVPPPALAMCAVFFNGTLLYIIPVTHIFFAANCYTSYASQPHCHFIG